MSQTLGIIKPDGVARSLTGEIVRRIEAAGLQLKALRMCHLSKDQARGFYAVHKDQSWFESLCAFMSEGPVVLMVLSGENAIEKWRSLMGATDPEKAVPGTIRKDFGQTIERNTTHGSDGPETARSEIAYFFPRFEICD
jgi:nucleoside-diphosphate kinase